MKSRIYIVGLLFLFLRCSVSEEEAGIISHLDKSYISYRNSKSKSYKCYVYESDGKFNSYFYVDSLSKPFLIKRYESEVTVYDAIYDHSRPYQMPFQVNGFYRVYSNDTTLLLTSFRGSEPPGHWRKGSTIEYYPNQFVKTITTRTTLNGKDTVLVYQFSQTGVLCNFNQ